MLDKVLPDLGIESVIVVKNSCLRKVLILGYESVFRLSQYIGDFKPEAQVKGFSGFNSTAFIFNRNSATFSALS